MAYNFILDSFPSCGAFITDSMSTDDLQSLTRWVQRCQLKYLCMEYFIHVHRNEARFRKGIPGTASEFSTPMPFASVQRYAESFGVETAGIPDSDYTLRVSEDMVGRYLDLRYFVPHVFPVHYGERNTITALVALLNIEASMYGVQHTAEPADRVIPRQLFDLVPALREAYRRNNPTTDRVDGPSRPSSPAIVESGTSSTLRPFILKGFAQFESDLPRNSYIFSYKKDTKTWYVVRYDEVPDVSAWGLESVSSSKSGAANMHLSEVGTASKSVTDAATFPVDLLLGRVRDALKQGVLPEQLVEDLRRAADQTLAAAKAKDVVKEIIAEHGVDFVRQIVQEYGTDQVVYSSLFA